MQSAKAPRCAKHIDVILLNYYWCLLLHPLDVLRPRRRGSRRSWGTWQLLPKKSTLCRNLCTKAMSSEGKEQSCSTTVKLHWMIEWDFRERFNNSFVFSKSLHLSFGRPQIPGSEVTFLLSLHKLLKHSLPCCAQVHHSCKQNTQNIHRTHPHIQIICPSGPVQWVQCFQIAQHLDECNFDTKRWRTMTNQ